MVATRRGTTPPPPPGRGVAAGDHRVVEPGRGLLKAAPHLVSVCWDPFLNGTADPSRLAPSSDRVAWWRCPNFTICGTVRLVSVRSKVASYRSAGQVRRCRRCVARERGGTGNTLAAWLPEAAAALVPTREHPLAAEVLSRWYPHKVTWRCLRESSHPLYRKVIGRRRKVPSCPACESLPLRRPHLAAQWHPDLNDRTPAEVTCGSQYRAWWQCPDKPEHVWQVAVAMRAGRQRTGCPECTLAHTSRTEIELWAELATLLDPLLGGQVSATPGPGGQQPVPASGAADRYAGRVWPHAAVLGATGGAVDMLLVLPATGPAGPARAVAVEYDSWHYHQGRQPHDDAKSARLRGLGYEVLRVREHPLPAHPGDVPVPTAPTPVENASAVLRALLERGWLDATSATVAHGYLDRGEAVGAALAAARLADRGRRDFGAESLEATHPDLVTDWDVDGNGTLTARHLRANSATQVMWICPLGDHYPAAPRDRAAGRGCPFCAGKRVNARNCVATTDPHLLPEWHPDSPVTPTAVTRGSQQQGLWRCRKPGCGHVWAASVTNRARHGSGCPACAGLATTATNNLQVCFPEVAQIWHPTRNGDLTARQVVPGSSKRAWWRCSCGKEWRGAVCDRVVAAHQACRACSRRRARRGQSRDR